MKNKLKCVTVCSKEQTSHFYLIFANGTRYNSLWRRRKHSGTLIHTYLKYLLERKFVISFGYLNSESAIGYIYKDLAWNIQGTNIFTSLLKPPVNGANMKNWVLFLTACTAILSLVEPHGYLKDPPARGTMWTLGWNTPKNYNHMQMFCGGKQVR